ncbi:MAG TPA: hypothetical protein DF383_04660, partial [Deltaproteobacteria bacterium]|nr:hypothetical protein [Deltaproteobacteria bacterium]
MRKANFLILAALLALLCVVPSIPIECLAKKAPRSYGEILFFPESESRPSNDRHTVQAGQEVTVCIRLSPNASSYVKARKKDTIGFRLIMEDSAVPPHRLVLVLGNRLQWMQPEAEACYGGVWQIPPETVPAVYQVSDLLWADSDQSYYSLRNYLYEFSRAEELKVQNPGYDQEPPHLVEIQSFGQNPYPLQYYGGVLRARVDQSFRFEDVGSGIDENSLRVFYELSVDKQKMGLKEAKCRGVKQKGTRVMNCRLQMNNPDALWALATVHLNLAELSIRDRAGNQLHLQGEKALHQVLPEAQLSFDFTRPKKWPP